MGCDIHLHAEALVAGSWVQVMTPYTPRHYSFFEELAEGSRGLNEGTGYKARGFPEDASHTVFSEYHLMVVEDDSVDEDTLKNWAEGVVVESTAESWIKSEFSERSKVHAGFITNPDVHHASYLELPEFKTALYRISEREDCFSAPLEYFATLAFMETFERNGIRTRVVFWFDG